MSKLDGRENEGYYWASLTHAWVLTFKKLRVNGSREQLAGADIPVSGKEWHTLALTARGNEFSVQFDGEELFTASDDTFNQGGRVGFWTKADSVTYFDRIVIEPLQP